MKLNSKNKYLHYYYNEPLNEYAFLLEGGQGKNVNGNVYAFLSELRRKKEWSSYSVYVVVCEDSKQAVIDRMKFYQYDQVNTVIRNSDEYQRLLATCKYLITDNSFPPYYVKRKGQIMLNTWHGTPLKTLGRCDIANSSSISNVQKNFTTSDYVLFPNKYTRDIFMEDYCLKNISQNKVILADYPRNIAFFNETLKKAIKDKYDLHGKQLFAYMPTWRGSSRSADIEEQQKITKDYLKAIDELLQDHQILYVNLHFLIGNQIDLSEMKHIRMFPKEYETYDFLNVIDVLISDYSSVFFDFAITKRKVVLFTYDLEEYIASRGMYFPIDDLPFKKVSTPQALVDELNNPVVDDYREFVEKFCAYADPKVVEHLLNLLVYGKEDGLIVEDAPYNGLKNIFIHVNLISDMNQKAFLLHYLKKLKQDHNYIVLFKGKITPMMVEFIKELQPHVQIYGYVTKNEFLPNEQIYVGLASRISFMNSKQNKTYKKVFEREAFRRFGALRMDYLVNLFDVSRYITQSFTMLPCEKMQVRIPNTYYRASGMRTWFKVLTKIQNKYFEKKKYINEVIVDENSDPKKMYNAITHFMRLASYARESQNKIKYSMWFLTLTNLDYQDRDMKVLINDTKCKHKFLFKKGLKFHKKFRLNHVKIELDKQQFTTLPIQNRVLFTYIDNQGNGFEKGIRYSLFKNTAKYAKSKTMKVNEELCCYFRKTINNGLYVTVRPSNVTDQASEEFKINVAAFIAKFRKKPIYLLFEKDSARYEESASVVYEKLIDQGYKNAYFILDRNYRDIDKIASKYRKNIIYKYSFKHYLYFFMCKTFLGSEALIHVLELRCNHELVLKKINAKENNYVFLQHGVMYMISLDSESRTFFKPRSIKNKGKYRVVTSSIKEAQHFIELGKHDPSQTIICGLPKFDKNKWNENADKIVIMPTWRPWEYNEAYSDFKSCKYYKMLERIYEGIDVKYRDKLIILPHPLFYKATLTNEFELKKYMVFDVKYDEILRDTKVLITDYSSIAYDAYYRGCNVMFYWEELEECLQHYGPSTKLMLNEENCFGDICYNSNDIKNKLEDNYALKQAKYYLKNYRELVNFNDGKNTDRLIESLKKDGIL